MIADQLSDTSAHLVYPIHEFLGRINEYLERINEYLPVITNSNKVPHLPPYGGRWGTLYELSDTSDDLRDT